VVENNHMLCGGHPQWNPDRRGLNEEAFYWDDENARRDMEKKKERIKMWKKNKPEVDPEPEPVKISEQPTKAEKSSESAKTTAKPTKTEKSNKPKKTKKKTKKSADSWFDFSKISKFYQRSVFLEYTHLANQLEQIRFDKRI